VSHGLSIAGIGVLAGIYPAVWGAGQLVTGALSDRVGRKWLISGGMLLQAAALGLLAVSGSFGAWAAEAALLGAGTAMVYPSLLAAIGDVAQPTWRASAVGVYRLWRDLGFAVGALLAGVVADLLSLRAAIWTVALITAASGVVVAFRMYETHRPVEGGERRLAEGSTSETVEGKSDHSLPRSLATCPICSGGAPARRRRWRPWNSGLRSRLRPSRLRPSARSTPCPEGSHRLSTPRPISSNCRTGPTIRTGRTHAPTTR